jgi:hypothetical protein
MQNAKPVNTPLAHTLSYLKGFVHATTTQEEKERASIPYFSAVEFLMYPIVSTRLDIAHVVGVVSRYLSNPRNTHWDVVKWILQYLRGASTLCFCFENSKPILEGFADADMASDVDNRRFTSGFLFTFAGEAISRQSKPKMCCFVYH